MLTVLQILLKNMHKLLPITISTNKYAWIITTYYIYINYTRNYHKKVYADTPKIFYYDTHKIIKKYIFFSRIYKNGPRKYYVL